jgi:hypothetical protein
VGKFVKGDIVIRAYPKNCVNDHKMVEIPRERKWSWYESKEGKERK